MITIRRAEPADAQALVELAGEVGGEEGAWLLTTAEWRSITEERRYLRAVRRHPDAAVYLAEDGDNVVGRLSLARDVHPASARVVSTASPGRTLGREPSRAGASGPESGA